MTRIAFETMQQTVARAFMKVGMSEQDAHTCARIHTETSCDGVYSHGLNRVARFVDYVQRGWVDIHAKSALVKKIGCIEIHDGARAPGILNALAATDRAMDMALEQGMGVVALRNTTHWMRGGTYGWRAANRGFVAICWTNTESCMPAWGGKDVRLGNNPFVMAVPREKGAIVLDMAMSQYAYGKLEVTRLKGETLPFPGGFDKEGHLTSVPGLIEASRRIMPTGYWKGSAMAIVLDTLAAVLSEGLATYGIDKVEQGSCTGCSQIFMLIDPRQLGGEDFTNQIADGVVDYVNSSELAEESREARYPGQGDLRIRLDQMANGIVVDDGVWAQVQALAQ